MAEQTRCRIVLDPRTIGELREALALALPDGWEQNDTPLKIVAEVVAPKSRFIRYVEVSALLCPSDADPDRHAKFGVERAKLG